MSDIRIAFYDKKGERIVNDHYLFYADMNNWGSNPPIIEEKIFCEDLNSGINYSESTNIGVPHFAHIFDSLSVRKTLNYSKFNYIINPIYDFNDPKLEHADIFVIHADVLVFLSDDEVEKMLSIDAEIIVDATFEAFVYSYYYPILKLFNDKYKPKNKMTFIVGSNKYNDDYTYEEEFEKYTNTKLKYFDYFRVNETLVGSSGLNNHFTENLYMSNIISEEQIINNFKSEKTKDFLCLNNRPRFHRMALIEKLRDLDLLDNNYVSRRWQYPVKKHIVQPLIRELFFTDQHSGRMIDELRIYGETPDGLLKKLKQYPDQIIIEDLKENIEVKTDKDNSTDLLDDRSFTNDLYKNSHYTLAVETYYETSFIDSYPKVLFEFNYKPSRAFLTEKVYKPIQYGHMFIPFSMKGTMRCLEDQGFVNFHEEFNCNDFYDWSGDDTKRYKSFIEIIKNFDSSRVNSNTLEKILHNYRHFYNKEVLMNYIDSFFEEIL